MQWIDWLITIVPVALVLWVAVYCRKYIRGVADYVAAGRVAGRYVMCVASVEAGLGVLFLVAMSEAKYQTGFAMDFWSTVGVPVGVIMGLTGYCTYRFRETKALSMGQFLEMRYSRSLRIFAAVVRTTAEMMCNAIAPAIAGNFFIYYLMLPHRFSVLGLTIPTFSVVVAVVLTMGIVIMWFGGRLSLLVVDCIQGLMSFPIFVIIVVYVLWHFSWSHQIAPAMSDRAPGESFLNPFDMKDMRDFNIFAVFVGIFSSIINRASWAGNDGSNAGRSAHEQKMAGILSAWRGGFSMLMCLVIAISVITFMCHRDFAGQAREVRIDLTRQIAEELLPDVSMQAGLAARMQAIPAAQHTIGVDKPYSRTQNADTKYLDVASDTFGHDPKGNDTFQSFRTLYHQMMMPLALRKLLPVGMTGMFCLLMVMLMLATDTGRMFNSSSTLIQDVVMPLRKKPLTPEQHLLWLRLGAVGVAVVFFVCSLFFKQMDFIWMFVTIMTSIWLGGAGPVMVGGLYFQFGNTVGAYSSIIVGATFSVGGIIIQDNWAAHVYPFINHVGWTPAISAFMEGVTAHTAPYVVWHMDAVKFPINSVEISFVASLCGILAYVVGSLVTYRGAYNLDRMLHRGQYNTDGEVKITEPWTVKSVLRNLIGITPECTRGDKILIWAVFLYSFGYQVGGCFILVVIWNLVSPWPLQWWSRYFFITSLEVSAVLGTITTVWFMVGGIIDVQRLFRDLAKRVDNPLDDGRVEGHVSLMDVAALGEDKEDRRSKN